MGAEQTKGLLRSTVGYTSAAMHRSNLKSMEVKMDNINDGSCKSASDFNLV